MAISGDPVQKSGTTNLHHGQPFKSSQCLYPSAYSFIWSPTCIPCSLLSVDGLFNFIEQRLQGYLYQVNTDQDLQAAIHQIIASMANFVNYFTNCGY